MTAKHLRNVPLAGMNMVLTHAAARGFAPGDPKWINLGQGQPEIGDIPGAPPRITSVTLDPGDHAYGPVNGSRPLREAVAAHYNRLYRRDRRDRYTADNVAIVAGGRPVLGRALAALGRVGVGYLLPDYAAYADLLDHNSPRITPVPVATAGPEGILAGLAAEGLAALLLSNPRNPTGAVIAGDDLRALVAGAGAAGCALLVDEFYSHYVYGPAAGPVSAAAHVEDVDGDQVVLIDGLTKNFRYPGWRLGWAVGPADTIAVMERVGQALDGGASQVVQRAALAALEPGYADAETAAVRAHFAGKRTLAVEALRAAGVRVDPEPGGTFYVWGDVSGLPGSLATADGFFRAALDHQVITVPGHVFDLDPGRRRTDTGAFDSRVRFSYGPAVEAVATGLDRIRVMSTSIADDPPQCSIVGAARGPSLVRVRGGFGDISLLSATVLDHGWRGAGNRGMSRSG